MIEKAEELLFSDAINPDLFKRKTNKIYEDIKTLTKDLKLWS